MVISPQQRLQLPPLDLVHLAVVLRGVVGRDQPLLSPVCLSVGLEHIGIRVQAAQAVRDNNDATAERMEADLTEQGMTIVAEEEVDSAAFRTAVQSCYAEMESYVGSDWLAKIKSEVGLS